jgi:hypothetical protein
LFDRLGDPSAPPRFRERPRRPEERPRILAEPPPPEPEPDEEEGDGGPLVCVRCCTTPVQLAWSQADGRLIHASVIGAPVPGGGPRICGGLVVKKGEEWRQAFAPGIVVPCFHLGAGIVAHLVRLGRPALSGGPSWSGTALCGKTNAGRNRNWRPLYPAAAAQAEVCQACRDAHALEGGR